MANGFLAAIQGANTASPAPATTSSSGNPFLDAINAPSEIGTSNNVAFPKSNPTVGTQTFKGQSIPANIPTKNLVSYDPNTGIKQFSLPSWLGGGVYSEDSNNNLVNTGHSTYGGEPKVVGMERDDIIPVSLGGTNQNQGNIKDVPFPAAGTQDTAETAEAEAVKQGQIAPKAAITDILGKKQAIASAPSLWDKIKGGISNLGEGVKQVAEYAAALPTQTAESIYNSYAKPSTTEQGTEQEMGLQGTKNPFLNAVTAPLRETGKAIFRTAGMTVEPFATLLGQAAGTEELANKVINGQAPVSALDKINTEPVNTEEAVTKIIPASIGMGLTLTPFLDAPARDAALKLSDLAQSKTDIPVTFQDAQNIVAGKTDLVDPEIVKAYQEATRSPEGQSLGDQIRNGKIEGKPQPTALSNFLKNSATRPISEIANFTKTFGGEVNVPTTKLLPEEASQEAPKMTDNGFPTSNPVSETPKTAPETAITPETTKTPTLNQNGFPSSNLIKPPETVTPTKITPTRQGIKTVGNETRVPTAAAKIASRIEEAKMAAPTELPEVKKMNVADQTAKSLDLIEKDPEKALNVAMGTVAAPRDLQASSVFAALREKALAENNGGLARMLAQSHLTKIGTGAGQFIKMFGETDPNNPVSRIQDIEKYNQQALEKQSGKKIGELRNETQAEVEKIFNAEKAAAQPKKDDWNEFISSIICS